MTWRRAALAALALALVGTVAAWFITAPQPVTAQAFAALKGDHVADAANGKALLAIGGCASCHATVDPATGKPAHGADATGPGLGGGLALPSPFGTFRVPNISPDPSGIGDWSQLDFANAMLRGITPGGAHYYPAFPYDSYARMTVPDLLDLQAHLATLPTVANEVADHDLPFPFSIRRTVGVWKRLYLDPGLLGTVTSTDATIERGRYLVEGPGHCAVCHTPRTPLGGPDMSRWMAGAPGLDGKGYSPNITGHEDGVGAWSAEDIAYSFETGFRPSGDIGFSGEMGAVQEKLATLPKADLLAIAAYLKALQPLPDAPKR